MADLTSALLAAQGGGQMAAAGSRIASNLFGGSGDAFQQGAATSADTHAKLLRARRERDAQVALSQTREKMLAAGMPEAQADLVANMMVAGSNYGDAMLGEGRRQEQGFRTLAHQAAVGRYGADNPNAHLFPLANAPQAMPQTMGQGAYVADRFAPDAPVELSELGQAMVGTQQASAQAHRARAGASAAQARLANVRADAGGFAPRAEGKADDELSEAAVLRQARQRVAAGADPAEVAAYLSSKGYPGVAAKLYVAPEPETDY